MTWWYFGPEIVPSQILSTTSNVLNSNWKHWTRLKCIVCVEKNRTTWHSGTLWFKYWFTAIQFSVEHKNILIQWICSFVWVSAFFLSIAFSSSRSLSFLPRHTHTHMIIELFHNTYRIFEGLYHTYSHCRWAFNCKKHTYHEWGSENGANKTQRNSSNTKKKLFFALP